MDQKRDSGGNMGQKRSRTGRILLVFLMTVSMTGLALCLRLLSFSGLERVDREMVLTHAKKEDTVETGSHGSSSAEERAAAPAAGANPGFKASDSQGVWNTKTKIELFRTTYENGERIVTAAGKNGNKVFAPGTENSYHFRLSNPGNAAMDYRMEASVTVSDGLDSYEVPLEVRLSAYMQRYLVGTEGSWAPMEKLSMVREKGVLGAESYTAYLLEWRWPFESGKDEFDTMLGNLAADKELSLTVTIHVTAEMDENPDATGGTPLKPGGISPKTGDSTNIWFYISLAAVSFVLFLLLLCRNRREEKDDRRAKEKK